MVVLVVTTILLLQLTSGLWDVFLQRWFPIDPSSLENTVSPPLHISYSCIRSVAVVVTDAMVITV